MSILILTLCLSHCSSTDIINVGAALYGGMEKKPNPIGVIKMLGKKDIKTHVYDRLIERPRNPPAGSGSYSSPCPPSGCVSERERRRWK